MAPAYDARPTHNLCQNDRDSLQERCTVPGTSPFVKEEGERWSWPRAIGARKTTRLAFPSLPGEATTGVIGTATRQWTLRKQKRWDEASPEHVYLRGSLHR